MKQEKNGVEQGIERLVYTVFCVLTFGALYLLRLAITIGVEKANIRK